MRRVAYSAFASLLFAALPVAAEEPGSLETTSPTLHRLQRELAELTTWLGPGPNGDRWRSYLKFDAIEEQLPQRERASRAVVRAVLARYRSNVPSLQAAPFVETHQALAAWLAELEQHAATMPPRERLAAMARAAEDEFRPVTGEDLQQAKAQIARAARGVENFLPAGTANTAAWRAYLRWDALQAELQPQVEKPDLQVLGEVYRRLNEDHAGLELPAFRELAEALRHYGDIAALAGQQGLEEWYSAQLERLATALEQYPESPTLANREVIGQSLGRFTSLGLAPQLVRAVRYHYSHPNFWADASGELIAAGFRDVVNRNTPIQDCILGTAIVGSGTTYGQVDLRLVPTYRRAILENVLTGNTLSNTRGYNRVVIYSAGNTALAARKWIILEPQGVRAPEATADAVTNTVTTGIAAGPLVQHIAQRQIARQRGQANAIAAARASVRLRESVDEEAADRVVQANHAFQTNFRAPLLRRGEFPRLLDFQTTYDYLSAIALFANRSQIGAPSGPPSLGQPYDLALRVHETLPNNAAEALLGGRTFESEQVKQEILQRRGSLPEQLQADEDEEPWSITFARRNPITVDFTDNGFAVTIRGQRYTSGDREFGAMNVSARYQIERTGEGLRLVRQGELTIAPPDFDPERSRLGAGDVALRTILQRKFGRLFPEEIEAQGIALPGRWQSAGTLQPALLQSSEGWLQVGWNMTPARAAAAD